MSSKNLHIDIDLKFLEEVEGKLIVTSLIQKFMPFIKYDSGDMGNIDWEHKCGCGFNTPILKNLVGKMFGFIVLPDGNFQPSLVLEALFRKYLLPYDICRNMKLSQRNKNSLIMYFEKGENFDKDFLEKFFRKVVGNEIRIVIKNIKNCRQNKKKIKTNMLHSLINVEKILKRW